MFSKLAVISVLSTAAWAQSTGSATATANTLIPTGISQSCSKFLSGLNTNADLLPCTKSLVQATANYGPSGNASSSPSATSMSSALTNICSSSTQCDPAKVRSTLASFYSSCTNELTSKNNDVIKVYDVLYALIPLRNAVCSKDDSGKWCVTQTGGSSTSTPVSASAAIANRAVDNVDSNEILKRFISSYTLSKRDDAVYPNMTTFSSTNLPFLFQKAEAVYATLCTACTRNVMTAYIDFESSCPYAPGLSNSQLLAGQTPLYQGIQKTCGTSFLSGTVKAAGSLSDGSSDNGSFKTLRFEVRNMVAAVLGVISLTFFAFL